MRISRFSTTFFAVDGQHKGTALIGTNGTFGNQQGIGLLVDGHAQTGEKSRHQHRCNARILKDTP
jgi:hypothetical protein